MKTDYFRFGWRQNFTQKHSKPSIISTTGNNYNNNNNSQSEKAEIEIENKTNKKNDAKLSSVHSNRTPHDTSFDKSEETGNIHIHTRKKKRKQKENQMEKSNQL